MKLIICDDCNLGFHTYCMNLTDIPDDQFFCKNCQEKKIREEEEREKIEKEQKKKLTETKLLIL